MNAPMIQDGYQQQPQQQEQYQSMDEIQMAKEALGLDRYEQQISNIQAQLQQSANQAMLNEMSTKYKDVPISEVQKAMQNLAVSNPQMHQLVQTSKDGLEMLFKSIHGEMSPKETPDEMLDGGVSGTISDFSKKLKNNTATEIDLGDFILENS